MAGSDDIFNFSLCASVVSSLISVRHSELLKLYICVGIFKALYGAEEIRNVLLILFNFQLSVMQKFSSC